MTKIKFDTIYDLIKQCKDRNEQNHELYIMDEPLSLCLGIFDHTTDEWLQLPVFKLRMGESEQTEEDLLIRKALQTNAGKCKLFNAKSSSVSPVC